MKSRKEIIQIVKHLGKRERGVPDRRLMHPNREWSLGVIVWIVLVCAGGAYAFLVFEKYSDISVESEMVEVDQLRYKRTDAIAAIELYSAKEIEYQNLVGSNNVPVPDVEPESDDENEDTVVEPEPDPDVTPEPVEPEVAEAPGEVGEAPSFAE